MSDLGGKSYRLLQNNLDNDIVADESKILVKKDKVIIKLQKVISGELTGVRLSTCSVCPFCVFILGYAFKDCL